ncbi:MAG: NHLP leader peptide family RiPP precursor [Eubacteriales bacterium SKADARSKE-1]|nr:NHLP leader peptide family RiPP precursor [Eubacteriales bacterium SKADARSKE-1]
MNMEKIYNQMMEKASSDPKFKEELLKDATSALKKIGVDFGDNVKVSVFESTPEHMHFVLPTNA